MYFGKMTKRKVSGIRIQESGSGSKRRKAVAGSKLPGAGGQS